MASRDPADLYKDKIEVSLDGRQIFYLFFGGAVIVGLVFVLGVMVGRRVEARGHLDQARTTAAVDPLAALDKLEGSGLSFQGALTGGEPRSDVERKIAELEKQRKAKAERHDAKSEPKIEPKPEPKPAAKPEPKPEVKADAKVEGKPEVKAEAKVEAKVEAKADAKSDAKASPKPEAKADPKAEAHDDTGPVLRPDARPDPKADAKTAKSDDAKHGDDKKSDKKKKPDGEPEGKPRFTLQLSSFQDKHEAEAFLASMKDAGYQPYLTEAEVTGKGTFYRVRLGSYRSVDAANDAKADLERTTKKTATVMRL